MERAELFPFVAAMSRQGRKTFGALRRQQVGAHFPLLRRGDDAGGAYLVVDGSLRVYYISDEGREATLYHVEPGGTCVVALSATMHRRPYPAWVEAGDRGAGFVCIASSHFDVLNETEPAFRSFVMGALSERVFELMCTLERVATATIEQRVARFLHDHAVDNSVAITQARLAADLGTAREVVFRALRSLVQRGAIATSRGQVRIVDHGALAEAAAPLVR